MTPTGPGSQRPPRRPRARSLSAEPRIRRGTVRVSQDVAARLRTGHPYVYREALAGRPLRESAGQVIDIVNDAGEFVARGLFDPEGVVALRVFSRDPDESLGEGAILARVKAARRLRADLLPKTGLTAYRLINAEGDGLPAVTVDCYGPYLVVHLYSAAAEAMTAPLYAVLEATLQPLGIYEQHRYRPQTGEGPRQPAKLVRGTVAPIEVEVEENGLKFLVDPTAPMSTGLFPDLREGRTVVRARAAGRRVLNLFSYTGAFSVYAHAGGATEIVSVDLSQKSHARTRRNVEINRLDDKAHELIAGDAFKVLARLGDRGRRFDLIILDPPPFGQSKGGVFSATRDYRDLVDSALSVAAPGALLACASNTHRMSAEELDRAIGEGAAQAHRYVRLVERRGLPVDFPVPVGFLEGHYLKFFLCAVA
jgi:23S rRNA (cytosine1962-C5)-methyltransferase